MADIYENVRQSFNWKQGKYKLTIQIESPDSFNLSGDEYEFQLSSLHVQELSANLNQVEKSYLNEIAPPVAKPDEGAKPSNDEVVWKWVYPEMYAVH